MKDPTATAARRNVEGQERAAVLTFRNEHGQLERRWFDVDTLRTLGRIIYSFTDESGEMHSRIKQEAADLLEQGDGRGTPKGTNS